MLHNIDIGNKSRRTVLVFLRHRVTANESRCPIMFLNYKNEYELSRLGF